MMTKHTNKYIYTFFLRLFFKQLIHLLKIIFFYIYTQNKSLIRYLDCFICTEQDCVYFSCAFEIMKISILYKVISQSKPLDRYFLQLKHSQLQPITFIQPLRHKSAEKNRCFPSNKALNPGKMQCRIETVNRSDKVCSQGHFHSHFFQLTTLFHFLSLV